MALAPLFHQKPRTEKKMLDEPLLLAYIFTFIVSQFK